MSIQKSDWSYVDIQPDKVFIRDLNLGNLSVTNDAENVYEQVQKEHPGKRLIYRDSEGLWEEIAVIDGKIAFFPLF